MDSAFDAELAQSKLTVQAFLKSRHPAWNLVGRVHFNLAENRKDEDAPFAFLATYTTRVSAEAKPQHLPLSKAMQESPVTLYTHPDCKDACQVARDVLNKRGVPFREKLVSNQQMMDELNQVSGGLSVPVMVLGSQVEKNASPEAFNQALDIAGYPRAGVARPGNQKEPAAPKPPAPPAAPTEAPAAPR